MGNLVKTHQEFGTQSASLNAHAMVYTNSDSDNDADILKEWLELLDDREPGAALLTWDGDPSGLSAFIKYFTDAVSLKSIKKFYAKTA